jgi:glucose-1-phosphatase
MQKDSIKNIIFDLGNVVININPDLSVKEMQKLGFEDFERSYSLLSQTNLFNFLEKGLISPDKFYEEINSQLPESVSNEKIKQAWGAMLLDFPKERIELIQSLSKKYRVFLLSNTNEIHYQQYNKDFICQFGFDLNDLFEKAYYSFELGMRKPDTEIFEHALNDSNLNQFETLFIDDLDKNIEPAARLGLNVMWLDVAKGEDIVMKLEGF